MTQTQILGTLGDILGLLTLVLAAIAAISLLVGGVGVSQHHAGVGARADPRDRAAQGARRRRRDITVQFLIEAVLLTTIGGVIGMALGDRRLAAWLDACLAAAGGHRLVVAGAGVRASRSASASSSGCSRRAGPGGSTRWWPCAAE